MENEPYLITAYLTFLGEQTSDPDKIEGFTHEKFSDMASDLAQLIVERSTIMAVVLPDPNGPETVVHAVLSSLVDLFHGFLCAVSVCVCALSGGNLFRSC